MVKSTVPDESDSAADAFVAVLVDRLTQRLQAGKPVDIEELTCDHPEYAERLRQLLPVVQAAAKLGPPHNRTANADGEPLPLKRLGDFRLIREIGRGGMGVVYEAEQLTLGRRVALKVMPFAAILDPRQLERFKNEAKASATLHHSNIVPVHSVGCDRGVHYYAMQFIDGYSLAAILERLRQAQSDVTDGNGQRGSAAKASNSHGNPPDANHAPAAETKSVEFLSTTYSQDRTRFFQHVTQLAIRAAEALEHAHFHGIIHRDIKPANLLLDVNGHLWVTDFGLARLEHDVSMTMTGDVIGTLRYMSPEQAQGDRHLVDSRTDVYSLGATLYELLTLRPVFASTDHSRLLKQIADEEARPLRAMDRRIPVDLETIVLKSLQKCPEDRYSSAQAMADDLQRFLEQRPIQAKPPTHITRLIRWSRRNHTLVLTTSAVLLVGFLLLAAGTALLFSSYGQQVALRTEAEAAVTQRDDALTKSEESLQTAVQAIDEMYFEVAEKLLVTLPAQTPQRREFLEKALQAYERVLSQKPQDPALRYSLARVNVALGHLEYRATREERANRYSRAIALLEQLMDEFPVDEDYFHLLTVAYGWKAYVSDDSEEWMLKGLCTAKDNLRRHPDSPRAARDIEASFYNLANTLYFDEGRLGDVSRVVAEGSAFCQDALRHSSNERLQVICKSIQETALNVRYQQDRTAAPEVIAFLSEETDRGAEDIASQSLSSKEAGHRYILAWANVTELLVALSNTQLANEQVQDALNSINRALATIESKVQNESPEPRLLRCYVAALWVRGCVLWRMGRDSEAKIDMAEAIGRNADEIHLVACPYEDLRNVPQAWAELKYQLSLPRPRPDKCISVVLAQYRLEDYESCLQQIQHYQDSVFEYDDPVLRFLQAACLLRLGRSDEARAAFDEAMKVYDARPTFRDLFDITCHEVMRMFE